MGRDHSHVDNPGGMDNENSRVDSLKNARRENLHVFEEQGNRGGGNNPLHNLPLPRSYVEPDNNAERILEQLGVNQDTKWIIEITGLPGMGKTTLALEVAHRCRRERSFDAIVWIEGESEILTAQGIKKDKRRDYTSVRDLLDEVARVLGKDSIIKEELLEKKCEEVEKALKENRCLLIIDNCETIGGKDIVEEMKRYVQPTKIIITSRHRIDEVDQIIELKSLMLEPALKIMRAECEAKSVKASDEELKTLFERTGGNPLAMIWCIGGMCRLPVKRVLKSMENVDGDLLQYCFAKSLKELSPEAKRLLRILSLFATSAGYDSLYAISGIENECKFNEVIGQIMDMSLSIKEGERYSVLTLTREFVIHEEPDEADRLRDAYAEYFVQFAKEHNSRSDEDLEALEIEHRNIKEAVYWIKNQKPDVIESMLPELVQALHEYLWLRGYWNDLVEYNELAFMTSKGGKVQNWSQIGEQAFAIGFTRFQQGNYEEADNWGKEAVEAAKKLPDNEYCTAKFKRLLAMVARVNDDYHTSKRYLDEMLKAGKILMEGCRSEDETRKIKDDIILNAKTTLANLERDLGKNYSEARRLYEEALVLCGDLNDNEKSGLNYNHLGRVDLEEYRQAKSSGREKEATGFLELAEDHFEKGCKASGDASRTDQILNGIWGMARVKEERGDYAQSMKLCQKALKEYGHSGAAEVKDVIELLDRVKRLVPGERIPEDDSGAEEESAVLEARKRDQIFISYSHNDEKYKDELLKMMEPYIQKNLIKVWDDTKIEAGSNWENEIETALSSAKVAVLLVSMEFLASDFISKDELPKIFEAAEKNELRVFWILVGECAWDENDYLKKTQAAHSTVKSLRALTIPKRNKVLKKICKDIKAAISAR